MAPVDKKLIRDCGRVTTTRVCVCVCVACAQSQEGCTGGLHTCNTIHIWCGWVAILYM